SPKLVNHRLNVRMNVPVLLGKRPQVTLEFQDKLNLRRLSLSWNSSVTCGRLPRSTGTFALTFSR
ncbi:MAG: hypothetical protein KAR25_08325, partial [Methanosarcinales archaeon]|nr:hypothetical protein [Methanosarcinales archaeon]